MSDDFEPTNDSLEDENEAQGSSWDDASDSEMAAARTAEESYAPEGDKKRLNRGAIIFMASCVICVVGFYLFHLKQKPQEASAQQQEAEAKLDKALHKLVDKKEQEKSRQLFEDTEEMVQAFYEYPTKQQVSLKDLNRNPFTMIQNPDDPKPGNDDAKKLQAELTKKAGELQLQSVLQGPRGAQCLINGEIYGEGEKVADTFVIKSISNGSVVLVAKNMKFMLKM